MNRLILLLSNNKTVFFYSAGFSQFRARSQHPFWAYETLSHYTQVRVWIRLSLREVLKWTGFQELQQEWARVWIFNVCVLNCWMATTYSYMHYGGMHVPLQMCLSDFLLPWLCVWVVTDICIMLCYVRKVLPMYLQTEFR